MVVGGSRQQTLDPGFVLLGTRQQGNWCSLTDSISCHPASQSQKPPLLRLYMCIITSGIRAAESSRRY
ncbi:unnamed protein product [Schistosoma margrebowiei]|uniref:Uncharacterized protein n=1 Tax=Schistosoma margrebowiei TaxID=48269 RepID=A0A183M1K7_9TREM|nr:unnamed protein product [Schistosoma margrebowiei]